MKKMYMVSLCRQGILGGWIIADDEGITYKTGKVTQFWKDYYARKGFQVPEGCPGSNPGDLSRSPKLRFLFSFR